MKIKINNSVDHEEVNGHLAEQARTSAAAHLAKVCINPQILLATGAVMKKRVFVDTGCAISIINNMQMICNLCKIQPVHVQGFGGGSNIDMAGDLHLKVVLNDGVSRVIMINSVLFDPELSVNLVSADQLRASGFSVRIEPQDRDCCIVLNLHDDPIVFPLRCENKIFSLYLPSSDDTSTSNLPNTTTATQSMSVFAGNISLH
eukprot:3936020-Rhodomonas_salina.1